MRRGKSLATVTAASFLPSGASANQTLIDGTEKERRGGKELASDACARMQPRDHRWSGRGPELCVRRKMDRM